ncbi:universal stress protein [Amycolatopsis lurida]|uniref:universal stress protein n=1 Tax=Amycolatopsis lurida TaxID=31959 RepID=UPI00366718E7
MRLPAEGAIVAGIDGSGSARAAAMWAADEALRRGLPLRLVHVYSVPAVNTPGVSMPREAVRAGFESRGHEWLAEARKEVLGRYPDLVVETAAREWSAVPALVQESLRATMVVLGSRGLGGFTGMLVGSTAVALAHHGHCPIVVARGKQPDGVVPVDEPVVVGTDGSPSSAAALAFAFDEAQQRETRLVVVRTWSVMVDHGAVRPHFLDVDPAEIEAAERADAEAQIAPWQETYPDVEVELVVRKGRPARTLLEFSEKASLLVVGSRGRGGFQGMVLGSTSQALVAHSDCPVAVIRPAAPPE